MARICDRCDERTNMKKITIDSEEYELCGDCFRRIKEFVKTPQKKGIMQQMFK